MKEGNFIIKVEHADSKVFDLTKTVLDGGGADRWGILAYISIGSPGNPHHRQL